MPQRRADGGKHISTTSHIRQEIIEAGEEPILVRPPASIPIRPKREREGGERTVLVGGLIPYSFVKRPLLGRCST